uniref:Uncharacterized protein n=1 Tax=Tanacetum cinerariifolium TaxID=118510 RepID=A0A6L2K7X7_TANCI|nr:hypothetical protein [Tanacetum cinerariifolium]
MEIDLELKKIDDNLLNEADLVDDENNLDDAEIQKVDALIVDIDEEENVVAATSYNGMEEDDVVDHIANFLEILDPIKIAIFDTNQLRVNIFPLSLTAAARVWWLSEKDNKITSWECLSEEHDDKRIDRLTKSALGHAWIYKWGINSSENDIASSDEEWEESGNENLPNTIGDSLLKPNVDTRNKNTKQCENGFNTQKAPSSSNMEDSQPNEKRCRVENFEVIKYSVRGNEEFLAIHTREYNSWTQTVNGVSSIYRDIFSKKDNGWTVHRTKNNTAYPRVWDTAY